MHLICAGDTALQGNIALGFETRVEKTMTNCIESRLELHILQSLSLLAVVVRKPSLMNE